MGAAVWGDAGGGGPGIVRWGLERGYGGEEGEEAVSAGECGGQLRRISLPA